MNFRKLLVPSLAFGFLLDVLNSDWVYSSLYYYSHPPWKIYLATCIPVLFVFLAASAGARWMGEWRVLRLFDVVTTAVFAFVVYNILKRNGVFPGHSSLLLKLAIILGVLAAAFLGTKRAPQWMLGRWRLAVLTGSLIFLLVPELVFSFEASKEKPLLPFFTSDGPALRVPTVVLVLDELSAIQQSPVETALRASSASVHVSDAQSAGPHTLSSVPGLWTGVDMAGARPCLATAVCADIGLLDYSRQTVRRARVDVVGFWHPYCLMRGLEYCRQVAVFGPKSILVGYMCDLIGLTNSANKPEFCEREWLDPERAARAREEIKQATFEAPFWRTGGLLYVHTLLPHPPAAGQRRSLDDEYAANLELAAQFAAQIEQRLQSSFGSHHRLVVTADHPLRYEVWCTTWRYRGPDCARNPRFRASHVPLIVAGEGAESLPAISNTLDLFTALGALDGSAQPAAAPRSP